jgi:hypothetical protein
MVGISCPFRLRNTAKCKSRAPRLQLRPHVVNKPRLLECTLPNNQQRQLIAQQMRLSRERRELQPLGASVAREMVVETEPPPRMRGLFGSMEGHRQMTMLFGDTPHLSNKRPGALPELGIAPTSPSHFFSLLIVSSILGLHSSLLDTL